MLSKLAVSQYEPVLVLQHVHDYLQSQNRYNMSILPRMKLKNKIADMWIDLALLARNLNLSSADMGGSTTYDYNPAGYYTEPYTSHKA